MSTYIVRRLLLVIPTVMVVTVIIFVLLRLIPGDIIDLMAVEQEFFSQMDREDLERALGLDVPLHIQYFRWAGDVFLHGDLGASLWTKIPCTDEIGHRLPITIELTILSLIVQQLIALPIGIYSAVRQDTKIDYVARSFAIACIALPPFWIATLIICFGSIWFGWSPSLDIIPFTEDPLGNLKQFMIPAIVMGITYVGTNMRLLRAMMLEVLRQDYVRTAWAKGLRERVVIMRHALKNALIPVVTLVGTQVPSLIGSAVIIEQIFGLPGLGRLVLTATSTRDYTMVSGIVLFLAVFVLLLNLFVDLTYGYIDPRIRYK